MAKTDLNHEFRMAALARHLPSGLLNMHSSNPAPLAFKELAELINFDVNDFFSQVRFDYAAVVGSTQIRELIVEQHYQTATTEDIITTCGAQEALFMVMNALLSAGDEVLCFSPIFEPLYQEAAATGARVTAMPLQADNGWHIDWPLLEHSISPQTRMLIINFPHNPTGCHITKSELQRLIDLCRRNDCWLISDEVFRGLEYHLEHESENRLPAAVDCYDKAISLTVMSKAYGLPAIRLGWIACRQLEIRQKLETIKRHLSICGSGLDEAFAARVLPHSALIFQRHTATIKKNLEQFKQLLATQDSISCHLPTAGATCFPLLNVENADKFVNRIATQHSLMLIPGSCFLTEQPGFRLTLGDVNAARHYGSILKI